MKKLLLVALSLALLGGLVFASGGQEAAEKMFVPTATPPPEYADDEMYKAGLPAVPDRKIDVEFLCPWANTADWFLPNCIEGVIERNYPNMKINVTFLNSGPLKEAVNTKLVGGVPPTAAAPGGSYYMMDWVKANAIVDVSEYWQKYKLEDVVPAGIRSGVMFDGVYRGVGLYSEQNNILWWNKTVFKNAGFAEPPYKSWDEFFEAADAWKDKADVPFWADGLNPPWFTLARSIGIAAERFGAEVYQRICNGVATRDDFKNQLTFHKKLLEYANKDFASVNSISGPQQIVARGDAALCFQGLWARGTLEKAGLELKKTYDFDQLPPPFIFVSSVAGLCAFTGSGNEEAGVATIMMFMTKEFQVKFNIGKGGLPIRTDIKLDPDKFGPISLHGEKVLGQGARTILRAKYVLPTDYKNEYAALTTGYLSGAAGLDKTLDDLVANQKKFQNSFTIDWKF
jgi:glucose/mannose transport system substrate-binding protein